MDPVPAASLIVCRYRASEEKIAENQSEDVLGWLTKNSTHNMPRVVRVEPDVLNTFPNQLKLIGASRNRGAVNGTALMSASHKVRGLHDSERPRVLYRVVHGDQPHKGLKSRLGHGSDPVFFQIHLQKHLRWTCRELSPFLSATQSRDKAIRLAARYEVRGFPDIKIIRFRTSGPGWDHSLQRLWSARSLLRQLGLHKDDRPYFDDEYLIEHSIPEESIIGNLNWEEHKDEIDPNRLSRAYAFNTIKAWKRKAERKRERCAKEKAEAAEKRKADGLDESEPKTKKRKTGTWVELGDKMGYNTGA